MSALLWAALIGGGALGASLLLDERKAHAKGNAAPDAKAPPQRTRAESAPVYVTDEVEALGRVIRSEKGRGTRKQKIHIAWATRNLAREKKMTIAKMACSPCGRQMGGKRPVSTRLAARPSDLEIAAEVLAAPQSEDPTGGATHFIEPSLQDRLVAEGQVEGYTDGYAKVRKRWIEKYGWEPYYRINEVELWGPKKT